MKTTTQLLRVSYGGEKCRSKNHTEDSKGEEMKERGQCSTEGRENNVRRKERGGEKTGEVAADKA